MCALPSDPRSQTSKILMPVVSCIYLLIRRLPLPSYEEALALTGQCGGNEFWELGLREQELPDINNIRTLMRLVGPGDLAVYYGLKWNHRWNSQTPGGCCLLQRVKVPRCQREICTALTPLEKKKNANEKCMSHQGFEKVNMDHPINAGKKRQTVASFFMEL